MPAKKTAKKATTAAKKEQAKRQSSRSSPGSTSHPPELRPTMLLVLGMHRSGTSVTTRLLECLDAVNSTSLMPQHSDNPKGFFEDYDIYRFHESKLLPSLKTKWHGVGPIDWTQLPAHDRSKLELEALEILRSNYSLSNRLSVLKEPRIGVLLPFWLPLLKRAGYKVSIVCAVRDPLSVARSLGKRDKMSTSHSGALYLSYWLSILTHIQDQQVAFVQFDDIFENPNESLNKVVSKLAILPPDDYEERLHAFSSSFIDSSLRHSHSHSKDLLLEPDLPQLTIELYETLLVATCNQNVKKALPFTTKVNDTLSQLAPILLHHDHLYVKSLRVKKIEANLEEVSKINSTVAAESKQLESALERESLLRGQVAEKITGLENDRQLVEVSLAEVRGRSEQLQHQLDASNVQLQTADKDKQALTAEVDSLKTNAEQLQHQLDASNVQLQTADKDKQALTAEVDSLKTNAEQLQHQLDASNAQLQAADKDKQTLTAQVNSLQVNVDQRFEELAKLSQHLKEIEDSRLSSKIRNAGKLLRPRKS
jgi:hypothetical protein